MWLRPLVEPPRLRWFATGFAAVAIGFPLIYAAVELGEPFVRDRPKATQFPGRLLAETITRQWRETTGLPLSYVGGAEFGMGPGEFAANNIAVYSPELDQVFLVPVDEAPARGGHLRLTPTRNGQAKGVRWARDYVLGTPSDLN